ncbi:hypothetical protein LY78DRAFT_687608 [Colletotrichum sublineola]|nr:hypothetical protein LY78DRAFT_687608 [Colletotrichum sublineola]
MRQPTINPDRVADASHDNNPPAPAPDQNSNVPVKRRKHQITDPSKFDGTRKNFQRWSLEMKGKMEIDGESFESDCAMFAYIYSRLDKTAQSMGSVYYIHGADCQYSPN